MCAKKIPIDWMQYYRFRPVLMETFVEKNRFQGTCYKAANWVHVGQIKGRGKPWTGRKNKCAYKRYMALSDETKF